jgi:hypothetical protein
LSNLATAEAMLAAYNAQDADLYVSYMTEDASEAGYRGDVVREGKEGTRTGLAAVREMAGKPRRSPPQAGHRQLCPDARICDAPASDGSPLVEPFEVIAVYSFEGDKCSRVEFIR